MIFRKSDRNLKSLEKCHGGVGTVEAQELLLGAQSQKGIRFFHETSVPAGASVGEHEHQNGRQELFMVLRGQLVFHDNGVPHTLESGDICYVTPGEKHAIVNESDQEAAFIVIGVDA